MKLLDLTLDTPAANLALDEALLEAAEAGDGPTEVLRLWESAEDFVVLGRSSDLEGEVNREACRADGVEIYRRNSGGGVVTVGPGCLMVSVVLPLTRLLVANEAGLVDAGLINEGLINIDVAHRYVLERTAAAVNQSLPTASIRRAGTSDLVIEHVPGTAMKFSGNSLRVKRRHVLYHGTLLYDYDLAKIARWLGPPKRMPDYRGQRQHEDFVKNLRVEPAELKAALVGVWKADTRLETWPRKRTQQLTSTYQRL